MAEICSTGSVDVFLNFAISLEDLKNYVHSARPYVSLKKILEKI